MDGNIWAVIAFSVGGLILGVILFVLCAIYVAILDSLKGKK